MRTWRILTEVIKREYCYFPQRSIHCVHVDTGVLCDEVGHWTPFFTTNKSNKVEGTVTNLRKSWYFERLTKNGRFKYLLKQLDGSSLLDIVRQVVPSTRASDRERTLCVCVCVGVYAHVRVGVCVSWSVCICLRACVCMFPCVCVRMCVCAYACISLWLYARVYACMHALWACMCVCERILSCVYGCICVYKDRALYSQNANGS